MQSLNNKYQIACSKNTAIQAEYDLNYFFDQEKKEEWTNLVPDYVLRNVQDLCATTRFENLLYEDTYKILSFLVNRTKCVQQLVNINSHSCARRLEDLFLTA